MSKYLLLLVAFLLPFFAPVFGQDKILYRNGQEELVKVLEVSPDSVFYTGLADSAQTKMRAIPRISVFMITYQSGTKQVMDEMQEKENTSAAENTVAQTVLSEQALYLQGQRDAKNFHKASGAFLGTFGTSLILPLGGPLLGVGTGIIICAQRVPDHKIVTLQPALKQNRSYLAGYQNQARKKKIGNAAAGVGAGTVVVYVALMALLFSNM